MGETAAAEKARLAKLAEAETAAADKARLANLAEAEKAAADKARAIDTTEDSPTSSTSGKPEVTSSTPALAMEWRPGGFGFKAESQKTDTPASGTNDQEREQERGESKQREPVTDA